MSIFLTDMADVLRAAGLRVMETPGWQQRAYPKWGGYTAMPTHVMVHHTASKATPPQDLNYILNTPLSPIGNLYLDRSGVFWIVAAGQAVTNGKGSSQPWAGGVPDDQMNHYSISIEAANDGVGEPWPVAQTDAYVRGCKALCVAYGIPSSHVRGHFEWAPGRKIDPAGPSPWAIGKASWDMNRFRTDVANCPVSFNVEDNMIVQNPPRRVYDSRPNQRLAANEARTISIEPTGSTAKAALVNLTVVNPAGNGYLVAWGAGAKPATSSINFTTGVTGNNLCLVPLANGAINVQASVAADLVVDVQGVYP